MTDDDKHFSLLQSNINNVGKKGFVANAKFSSLKLLIYELVYLP